MTALASAISRALIHFIWQGAIVSLCLLAVLYGLKRRSANSRYMASCAALLILALAPVVTTWVLYANPAAKVSNTAVVSHVSSAVGSGSTAGQQRALWLESIQFWALPIWSAGVLAFSIRLILGYRHAFLLRRRGKPATESAVAVVGRLKRLMGVGRPIRTLISPMSDSPSVVG